MVYVEVLLTLQHSDYWISFFLKKSDSHVAWKGGSQFILLHFSIFALLTTLPMLDAFGLPLGEEEREMDGENQRAKHGP